MIPQSFDKESTGILYNGFEGVMFLPLLLSGFSS